MDYTRLRHFMAAAKLARIIVERVYVDADVVLPDGTFIAAGTDMADLDDATLDALSDMDK